MSNIACLFLPLAFSSLPVVLPFVFPSSQVFLNFIRRVKKLPFFDGGCSQHFSTIKSLPPRCSLNTKSFNYFHHDHDHAHDYDYDDYYYYYY